MSAVGKRRGTWVMLGGVALLLLGAFFGWLTSQWRPFVTHPVRGISSADWGSIRRVFVGSVRDCSSVALGPRVVAMVSHCGPPRLLRPSHAGALRVSLKSRVNGVEQAVFLKCEEHLMSQIALCVTKSPVAPPYETLAQEHPTKDVVAFGGFGSSGQGESAGTLGVGCSGHQVVVDEVARSMTGKSYPRYGDSGGAVFYVPGLDCSATGGRLGRAPRKLVGLVEGRIVASSGAVFDYAYWTFEAPSTWSWLERVAKSADGICGVDLVSADCR